MRIAIVGYGRMGRMIHSVAAEKGIEVSAIIDPYSTDAGVISRSLSMDELSDAEVVIDFSSPESVFDNLIFYGRCGVPAVIGTTGWYDRIDELKSIIDTSSCSILYSGNFSIGIAVYIKTVEKLSRMMNRLSAYDVALSETHHTAKADSPSGTALMIAEKVMENMERKKGILVGNSDGRIDPSVIQISSMRVGKVPGIHELVFDSDEDTITLTHSARSRRGFATGAILAASWLFGRKGLFCMDDFIDDFLA